MTRQVILTAFEAYPKVGTEAGLAWMWARSYGTLGFKVTVITSTEQSSEQLQEWRREGISILVGRRSTSNQAPLGVISFIKSARAYSSWRKYAERNISELGLTSSDIVHHVAWGSARLRHPLPAADTDCKVIWGPLGGGQLPVFRGLRPKAYAQELIRLTSFIFAILDRPSFWRRRKRPDIVFATNRSTQIFLRIRGLGGSKLMLADGVEQTVVKNRVSIPECDVRLFWAGRLVATKRPDLAVKIAARLNERVKTNLVLAGTGPELDNLIQLAQSLRVEVVFCGKVRWERMFEYYKQANLFLFHSMRDSSCPAVLEAASFGLPSVGLRVSGAGDMVPIEVLGGPNRFKGETKFVAECCEEILVLLGNPTKYLNSVQSAIHFAQKNTWDAKVNTILHSLGPDESH